MQGVKNDAMEMDRCVLACGLQCCGLGMMRVGSAFVSLLGYPVWCLLCSSGSARLQNTGVKY